MEKIRQKYDLSIVFLIAVYLIAIINTVIDYVDALSFMRESRGFMCVGAQIICIYAYIHFFPTRLVPKRVQIFNLLLLAGTVILGGIFYTSGTAKMIIEITVILIFMYFCLRKQKIVKLMLKNINISNFALSQYNINKIYELSIINFLLLLAMLISSSLVGLTWVTISYSIITVFLLIIFNYTRMFTFNYAKVSKLWLYVLENIGIMLAFILTNVFTYYKRAEIYFVYIAICLLPHIIISISLGRELKSKY